MTFDFATKPLDRGVFKSLKSALNKACHFYMKTNPTRKITKQQFGKLLAVAWSEAATIDNAVSSLRATGILPYNLEAIPEHAYSVFDAAKSSIGTVPPPPDSSKLSNVVTEPMAEHLPDP
ncbi:hypothetical protein HHI36_016664 [Cryptolaemus montrouzieri]|uniref:Uncharacterized protein n=1 Tax=Cryptolaemus montrouzieri TaxID=559131 RepID=A0ABD2NKG2_9CUCU